MGAGTGGSQCQGGKGVAGEEGVGVSQGWSMESGVISAVTEFAGLYVSWGGLP